MQVISPILSTGSASGTTGLGANGGGVLGAIQGASRATGASFDYLLTTARVESNFNPAASAKTSSAKGLFQFIDSTWLATMKQSGGALGYGKYANAITHNASDGSYTVSDPGMRQQILALRNDAKTNAAMAGAFTNNNATQLSEKIGHKPTDGELYIAHFMGVNGAAKLINAANQSPNQSAASLFPRAANANKSIFYDKQTGQARSASGVYANIIGRYDAARSANATAVAAMQAAQGVQTVTAVAPASATTATATRAVAAVPAINLAPQAVSPTQAVNTTIAAKPAGPMFHNMFANEARQGAPVSRVISNLWSSNPRVAAALTGQPSTVATVGSNAVPQVTGANADMSLGGLYRNQSPNASAIFGAG